MLHKEDIAALKSDALRLGLRELFTGHHFNVCKLDKLLKLYNITPCADIYHALHALHCVHYCDMSRDQQERIYATVLSLFTVETFNLELIDHLAEEVVFQGAGSPSVMKLAIAGVKQLTDAGPPK